MLQVYLEGPYGAPMIDLHGPRYKCFILICSGMGWTFGRALKRQLLADAVRGRPLKSVRSVAVVREQTAGALDSCWGWDLRAEEGETWPAELLAQVRSSSHLNSLCARMRTYSQHHFCACFLLWGGHRCKCQNRISAPIKGTLHSQEDVYLTGRGPMLEGDGVYEATSFGDPQGAAAFPVATSGDSCSSLDASGSLQRPKVGASSQLSTSVAAPPDVGDGSRAHAASLAHESSSVASTPPLFTRHARGSSAASSSAHGQVDRALLHTRSGSSITTVPSDIRATTNPLSLCDWQTSPRAPAAASESRGTHAEEYFVASADGTSSSSNTGMYFRTPPTMLRGSNASTLAANTSAAAESDVSSPHEAIAPARLTRPAVPRARASLLRPAALSRSRGAPVAQVQTGPPSSNESSRSRNASAGAPRVGQAVGESAGDRARSPSPPPQPQMDSCSASQALSQLEGEAEESIMLSSRPRRSALAGTGDSVDVALDCALAAEHSAHLRSQSLGARTGRRALHDSIHSTASGAGNTMQREQAAKLQAVYEAAPVLRRAHPFFAMFGRSLSRSLSSLPHPPETVLPVQTCPPRAQNSLGASAVLALSSVLRGAEDSASVASSNEEEEQDTVASWTPPRIPTVAAPRELIAEEFHASLNEPPEVDDAHSASIAASASVDVHERLHGRSRAHSAGQPASAGHSASAGQSPSAAQSKSVGQSQRASDGTNATKQRRSTHASATTAVLSSQRVEERTQALARLAHEVSEGTGRTATHFHRGRPDFARLIADAAAEARQLGESRVAVFVCGNAGVAQQCLKHCGGLHDGVQFDCHNEAFSFH